MESKTDRLELRDALAALASNPLARIGADFAANARIARRSGKFQDSTAAVVAARLATRERVRASLLLRPETGRGSDYRVGRDGR